MRPLREPSGFGARRRSDELASFLLNDQRKGREEEKNGDSNSADGDERRKGHDLCSITDYISSHCKKKWSPVWGAGTGATIVGRLAAEPMCDETTEAENEAFFEKLRLNRREMGMGAGAAMAALLTGCPPSGSTPPPGPSPTPTPAPPPPEPPGAAPAETKGRMVTIDTADGEAEAFFVAPAEGEHPGVLMWPDVAGLRDAYEKMATRLAGAGYAVLAVNPYYRSSKMPVLQAFSEWRTEEGRAKIKPMREALTPEAIAKDGASFAAWLDQQSEVDQARKLATTGYCMGGPFTIRTAAAAPERVGAIASFHGGGLATDDPSSPHELLEKTKIAALICIAQNDDERDPKAKTILRDAATAADLSAEIEVYPARHGWCTIDSPVYDEEQAERAWARMLAIFEKHL